MKRKTGTLFSGIVFCVSFLLLFSGCYHDFKKDKVTIAEWEAAVDSIYYSFRDMAGKDFKITIETEQNTETEEFHVYRNSGLVAVSCGDKEYVKETITNRRTLKNGEIVSEQVTETEKYLERTQDGVFEYNFENGKWIRGRSECESMAVDRVTEYNEIHKDLFKPSLLGLEYDKKERGYVGKESGGGIVFERATFLYKIKDKKIVSISSNRVNDGSMLSDKGNETVRYIYDYGKQKVTLPEFE